MTDLRADLQAELYDLTRRLGERCPIGVLRGDDADRAVAGEIQELDIAARDRMVARAVALRCALARMDAGTYGKCALCGDLVGAARLRALPATDFCRDCAASVEADHQPRRRRPRVRLEDPEAL